MKKSLLAFTLVALISSFSVTECINEAEAQASVTQTVEAEAPIEEAEPVTEEEPVKEEPVKGTFWIDLGTFEITAYCTGTCCSSGTGITASGTVATVGRTIGVDPNVIPLGSTVKIVFQDGTEHIYKAEDTGSAIQGNIIDLLVSSHSDGIQFGRQTCRVYVEEINEQRN